MYIEYRVYIIIYRNVYVINSQNYIQIQKKKKFLRKNYPFHKLSNQNLII